MKTVACAALINGTVIGKDVTRYQGEVIIPAGTTVDDRIRAKLERNSIICVEIKEEIDFANTHFEKIRFSQEFMNFEKMYQKLMPRFKEIMKGLVEKGTSVNIDELMDIYTALREIPSNAESLLDFLYNKLPDEDELTHSHCLNSALIAGIFGEWMDVEKEKLKELILCGFFYDIGKLLLSDAILWKPGKLTDLEFMQIKAHTLNGYKLLEKQPLAECIKRCALMHHEKCDGSGYPSKLKKEQIDLYARYMAIVDAYEAMTSPRTYRDSLTPLEVIARFEQTGPNKYDDKILRPLLCKIAKTQVGLNVRLSDDSIWQVYIINQTNLSRPVLKRENEVLNLCDAPELKIIAIY